MQHPRPPRDPSSATVRLRLAAAGHVALCGDSPAVEAALSAAARVAPSDAPLLLRGEAGAGLESFARYVHALSPRGDEPFIVLRCGDLAELAQEALVGALTQAPKGTLYLDAIEGLSRSAQATLVRVLQSRARAVEIRIVAGTHVDATGLATALREELAVALGEVTLDVPPLRERREDIPEIARTLARAAAVRAGHDAVLSVRTLAALQLHRWLRNFPELEEMVTRLVDLAASEPPASTSGEYRTPVARVAVTITFADGRSSRASLFVPPGQRVEDTFGRSERFVPVDQEGVTRLYALDALACLSTAPLDGTVRRHGDARRVRVTLRSKAIFDGELHYAAEHGRARPMDFLNAETPSFELYGDGVVHVVAKAHVEHVEER